MRYRRTGLAADGRRRQADRHDHLGLGTALAGAGGVLARRSTSIDGRRILVVKCFVAVCSAAGSVRRVAGGIALGLVESPGDYALIAYKDTIGFVLFLLVLLFRPAGLFGVGRS
jgi:branched-chain amino acid transport system permease protein